MLNITPFVVDTDPGVDDTIAMLFFRVPFTDLHILTEVIVF